jgi:hypothetical protein
MSATKQSAKSSVSKRKPETHVANSREHVEAGQNSISQGNFFPFAEAIDLAKKSRPLLNLCQPAPSTQSPASLMIKSRKVIRSHISTDLSLPGAMTVMVTRCHLFAMSASDRRTDSTRTSCEVRKVPISRLGSCSITCGVTSPTFFRSNACRYLQMVSCVSRHKSLFCNQIAPAHGVPARSTFVILRCGR